MNRGKNLVIILMVTCALAWQIQNTAAEDFTPLLKVSASNLYLTAGEENMIEITLKNMGNYNVYEVKATLSVPETTTGITILDGAHKIYNKIEDEKSKTYNPVLYVDRTTPLGSYTLSFQVSYLKAFRLGAVREELTSVQIGVVVENVSIPELGLDVGMEALKIRAGDEDVARIGIENIGDKAVYKLDARVSSTSSYIVVLEGDKFTHEGLDPGSLISFNSTLAVSRHAPIGVYTLTASASYEDADGREYVEAFTLGVTVDSVLVANQTSVVMTGYATSPETIHPGDTVDLSLDLACLGAKAYDVKATLSLDPATGISPLSPTLVPLGDLEPGGRVEAGYRLLVDGGLWAGQYPAMLTLSYLDVDGVPRSLVESVTLSVRGIVEFSLINVEPIRAEKGRSTEFEADLLLVGTEGVQFADIEIEEDATFKRVSGSEEYIGAVDTDSPIPFDLTFGVAEEAEPGDHTLTLRISYSDDLNQEHEQAIELPVTVAEAIIDLEPPPGSRGGFWTWLRRLLGLGP